MAVVGDVPPDIEECTARVLERAVELAARSIAFPALGTGSAGVPGRECAQSMCGAIGIIARAKPHSRKSRSCSGTRNCIRSSGGKCGDAESGTRETNDSPRVTLHQRGENRGRESRFKMTPILFNAASAQPYGCFSNFFAAPVEIDGKTSPTTEHYFQAMSCGATPSCKFASGGRRHPPRRSAWRTRSMGTS